MVPNKFKETGSEGRDRCESAGLSMIMVEGGRFIGQRAS